MNKIIIDVEYDLAKDFMDNIKDALGHCPFEYEVELAAPQFIFDVVRADRSDNNPAEYHDKGFFRELQIRDSDGKLLAKSGLNHPEGNIRLVHEGRTYLVPNSPCAKKKDLTILAKSLIFLVGVGGFEPPTN